MSKKIKFIAFVDSQLFSKVNKTEIDPDVLEYWFALKDKQDVEGSRFTDTGKLILSYLQSLPTDAPPMKAKDIGENMEISSRSVSGAMRKLCSDGYVERLGKDPTMYSLTETGRNIKID